MRLPARVFLNPCDYLLYTDHIIRMRRRQGPNIAYMCIDIDGALDCKRMRAAVTRAMELSPATLSKLRMSLIGGWPFWRPPRDPRADAEAAIGDAYRYIDLRSGDANLNAPLTTTGENPIDFRNGPQICMTHYALPGDKSRVCIRWPHWLMDAAGTLAFLALWAKCYEAECGYHARANDHDANPGRPAGASAFDDDQPAADASEPDLRQWRPLAGASLRRRWGILRSQPKTGEASNRRVGVPCDEAGGEVIEHRVIHRAWDAHAMEQVRLAARRDMPAGQARVSRYLAVRVLRALDRLFEEYCWSGDTYRVTLPMRVRGLDAEEPSSLLLFGNYLVSPLLVFERSTAHDAPQLANELTRQLQAYTEARGDVAQWSLMSLAAWLPFYAHQWIFGLRMFKAHFSSGFSFYGELRPPLRSMADLPITNLWGGGPTTIPPGLNPVFSRFDKSLNLALTYSWPVVSDEVARRYIELIEISVLGSEESANAKRGTTG